MVCDHPCPLAFPPIILPLFLFLFFALEDRATTLVGGVAAINHHPLVGWGCSDEPKLTRCGYFFGVEKRRPAFVLDRMLWEDCAGCRIRVPPVLGRRAGLRCACEQHARNGGRHSHHVVPGIHVADQQHRCARALA